MKPKNIYLLSIFAITSCSQSTLAVSDYRSFSACYAEITDPVSASTTNNTEFAVDYIENNYHYRVLGYNFKSKLEEATIESTECVVLDLKTKSILFTTVGSSYFCGGGWKAGGKYPEWLPYHTDQTVVFTPSKQLERMQQGADNPSVYAINDVVKQAECQFRDPNVTDVGELNNIAYYLIELGYPEKAIPFLVIVKKLAPDRVPLYINFGDAFKATGQSNLAIQSYTKYIELMKAKGLESKIPKRVLNAVK